MWRYDMTLRVLPKTRAEQPGFLSLWDRRRLRRSKTDQGRVEITKSDLSCLPDRSELS